MKKIIMTDNDAIELTNISKKIKLFSSISMGLLEKILNRILLYEYEKGEKVCKQGEIGDSFYILAKGKLRVSVREAFFFSKTLAILNPGDCFGEMALMAKKPRNATVTCIEPSKIFVLTYEQFNQILEENSHFKEEINQIFAKRQMELEQLKK